MMDWISEDELMHYGMPRRSGRYPWGSGKESYQRTGDFLARIDELKKSGMSETDIAKAFNMPTTKLRVQISLANSERRADLVARAVSLREKGYSLQQITKEMGYKNDSSVRSLLNDRSAQKMDEAKNIAALLKKHIDEKGMIDVGAGIERELGTSKEKLEQALYILEMEGYPTYSGGVAQVNNPGKQTTIKVIGPPGTEHKDIYDYSKVNTITDYNTMTGECDVKAFRYPVGVDMKRLYIRYPDDGGTELDGTIELKRGVPDLDLGGSHYSQVRIMVGENDGKEVKGSHYLKGMAVYKDDDNFPPGCDIVFNTSKPRGTSLDVVLKKIKENSNNPFGSTIKPNGQSDYDDPVTGEKKMSAINKRADEGDWNEWSNALPSQFLGKQNKSMIQRQLGLSKADRQAELEEILAITNPTVKRQLLASYADDCDAAAVHLKAAALPRQRFQVILPINSLKDNEIYAPNYKDGEQLALVRYPHGGTFEIPILTVNNKNKDAIKMIGKNPKDAVCINSKVAERLSGADFDGDTAMVIPHNSRTRVKSTAPLEGLKGFNNREEYPARPGMKVMQKGSIGREMGVISNLITDMTLHGATDEELTRAVKHSMVVIDAYKHKLDYKKSEADHGIAALKKKYQTRYDADGNVIKSGGASTLLSMAKGEARVNKRVGTPKINLKGKPWYDPSLEEGALIYNEKVETYVDKKGKTQVRTQKSTKMYEAKDARVLSSGTPQEELYADYANSLKALANRARKEMVTTPRLKYNSDANKEYATEVSSLKHKLNISLLNAPKERQAQLLANSIVKEQKQTNPDLDGEDLKKAKTEALNYARAKFGVKRETIKITDREWEAIQKGAITDNVLTQIIQHADIDVLRSYATPRKSKELSQAQLNKIAAMKQSGYTNEEIATAMGISASTVARQ